jgi:hypothetical protein
MSPFLPGISGEENYARRSESSRHWLKQAEFYFTYSHPDPDSVFVVLSKIEEASSEEQLSRVIN